jgi:hypothetical protein
MNLSAIDVKRGLIGTLGILLTIVFIGILGPAGLLAGLCALFLGALDEPAAVRERLVLRTRFVVIGALVIGLLSWSGDNTWWATGVATVVTYLGTLAAGWGSRTAAEGQFIVLLTVVTLMVGPTDLSPIDLALAFVAGGVISTAVALGGARWAGDDADSADDADATDDGADRDGPGAANDGADGHDGGPSSDTASAEPPEQPAVTAVDPHTVVEVARSDVGVFSMIRALAVGVATALGYLLFEDHPVWAMLTVVLVLQMPARQTWTTGLQRTVGTVVGVLVGMVIVNWLDTGTVAIVIAFVLAGFGMMMFKNVSYTVSTIFTTCVLLFSQRILQEDAFSTGWQRIEATLLGTAIALAVVLMTVTRDRRSATAATCS